MLLLTVTGKEVSVTVVAMTTPDSLRIRVIEGFCNNLSSHSPKKRRNSLDKKPLRKIFKALTKG